MKDIVITEKRIRQELKVLAGCFVFAVLVDLFSIIKFRRPVTELLTTFGYEITIAAGVYLILALLRIVINAIRRLLPRR